MLTTDRIYLGDGNQNTETRAYWSLLERTCGPTQGEWGKGNGIKRCCAGNLRMWQPTSYRQRANKMILRLTVAASLFGTY